MKYVFVDTDNGGTPSNATPDTTTSKYHTTSSWPANGARWASLGSAFADTAIRGITDDLTIYCKGATADTAVATGTALTCANLVIEGDLAGAVWDTSKYRIVHTGANGNGLDITGSSITGNITVKKIQIELNGTSTSAVCCYLGGNDNNATMNIDSCIFRMGSTGRANVTGNAIGILYDGSGTGTTFNVKNSIIYGIGGTGGSNLTWGIRSNTPNSCTGNFYNNVIYDITTGGTVARGIGVNAGDILTVKNCVVFGTGSEDIFNADTIAHCATDDIYSGTGNINSLTWDNQFVNYTSGNFTLKSDSILIGAGIGPSSDANVPTTDISGNIRSGTTTDIGVSQYIRNSKLLGNSFLKFRPARQNRLMPLLVSETAFSNALSRDYFRTVAFKPTYRLTAETRNFVLTGEDNTTYGIKLDSRSYALTPIAANITKYDSISTFEITLTPSAGWSYVDIVSPSIAKGSVFQNYSPGVQVAYQTTTAVGNEVSVAPSGMTAVGGTGRGSFTFRIYTTAWSSELSYEKNPIVTITTVDGDNIFTVAQTGATIQGANLSEGDTARLRYGSTTLNLSYSPSASPTFTVPNLAAFLSSGMPLGPVTFELLRTT